MFLSKPLRRPTTNPVRLLLLLLQLAGAFLPSLGQRGPFQEEPAGLNLAEVQTSATANHQEILVQPNSQVRIECKVPPWNQETEKYQLWNFRQTATGAAKPHTLCYENKCQGAKSFGFYLESNPNSGTYDLVNNNVTYELNDGFYYCDYSETSFVENRLTREYRLTVLIPPQAPTIAASSAGPAREGQEHQLSCQSSGGNPEPNITWFRNNQQLPATGVPGIRIEQTRSNGTASSLLSLIPSLEDHQATYKCQVWNKAMVGQAPYELEHKLQVEYAPRISLGPVNPLRVLQGAQVSLSCSVDANPGVKSVKWFRDGQLISNQFNHTIQEARVSDSSVYTCQAENGIAPLTPATLSVPSASNPIGAFFNSLLSSGSGPANQDKGQTFVEAQLQLQVLYPPSVTIKPSRREPVQQGEPYQLTCLVDSNPAPYEYVWTKQEEPAFRRTSGQSATLEFPAPSASDAGNYTCTVFVRMEPSNMAQAIERQASSSFVMNVIHSPGIAEIVLGSNNEAELGSRTQIQCRAKPPGFPEPKYLFWKYSGHSSGQKIQLTNNKNHGPVFLINSVQASDEARYACVARNDLGTSTEADGELIVNEPPKVIDDSASIRNNDARPQGETSYSITIRAQAKPEPKVTWYHRSPVDGRRVELSSLDMQYKFSIVTSSKPDQQQAIRARYNVVTTLTFKQPLEVDDRGLYSVEFNNGLSKTAVQDFQLHINHTPVPAPRGQPVLAAGLQAPANADSNQLATATKLKAGFDIGDTVALTCRVSAWPRPEFEWSGESSDGYKPLATSARFRTSVSNIRDDIWESTLTFSLAQASDYGDYLCASANIDSRTSKMSENLNIIIKLSPKTSPDSPMLLEAIDSTQDSITLQWVAGFDGGYSHNQFLVQYALEDGSGVPLANRFPSAENQGAVVLPSSVSGANSYTSNMLDSIDMIQQQQQQQQQQPGGWPKLYDCQASNPCTIGHLLPRQAYVFRVRAKNLLGASNFGEELRASTRANLSQIPRIADGYFDPKNNLLRFKIEPGSDYLLNNLNARIEVRSMTTGSDSQTSSMTDGNGLVQEISAAGSTAMGGEWRALPSVGPLRQEKVEAYLAVPVDFEQIKITLCSRTNDSLCGPEYLVKEAASSFLHDQRGLSYSILVSSLTLIILLGAFATSLHSCCLARKSKKAETIEGENNIDNKPIGNHHHHHGNKTSHGGSTTSTNSTSAGVNGISASSTNGLQSMDSMNGNATASDHSSDHSRQAKLDSMLPPNYNHYADRTTLLMEQQQQQQLIQQQGLLADKLSSPFVGNFLNSALMNQQMPSPAMLAGGPGQFTYAGQQADGAGLSLENGCTFDPSGANMMLQGDLQQQQQQQVVGWPASQQMLDDYNNYNSLASAGLYGSGGATASGQAEQMMLDPTYGTTGANMMTSQYDTTQLQGYFEQQQQADYQQRAQQYQQDMAQAQQQMYGTLNRQQQQSNGYNSNGSGNSPSDLIDNNQSTVQNNLTNQQLMEHQQQQYGGGGGGVGSNGLIPPPQLGNNGQLPLPPSQLGGGQQESDYGTVGRSRSRVIREIIV